MDGRADGKLVASGMDAEFEGVRQTGVDGMGNDRDIAEIRPELCRIADVIDAFVKRPPNAPWSERGCFDGNRR